MKKILKPFSLIFAATISLFAISCKSTNIQLQEYSPVILMTVYSNPGVPWYEDMTNDNFKVEQEDEGFLTGFVNRALDRNNPETLTAQSRIDEASQIIVKVLQKNGISVLTPQNTPNAPCYAKSGKNFLDTMNNTLPASGYDVFDSYSPKLIKKTCLETGAKSALYVHFKFQKTKHLYGVRPDGVQARLVMEVFGTDSEGKRIINKTYTILSSEFVDLHNNKWDRDKLCSYFADCAESAMNQFALDFAYGDFSSDFEDSSDSENAESLDLENSNFDDLNENSDNETVSFKRQELQENSNITAEENLTVEE